MIIIIVSKSLEILYEVSYIGPCQMTLVLLLSNVTLDILKTIQQYILLYNISE